MLPDHQSQDQRTPGAPRRIDRRCPRCFIYRDYCVCSFAPRLTLSSRVVVFMHAHEWRRSSNTGRYAELALTNAEVRLHGLKDQPALTADLDQPKIGRAHV